MKEPTSAELIARRRQAANRLFWMLALGVVLNLGHYAHTGDHVSLGLGVMGFVCCLVLANE